MHTEGSYVHTDGTTQKDETAYHELKYVLSRGASYQLKIERTIEIYVTFNLKNMIRELVIAFSTISYLYTMSVCLLQFYVIMKEQIQPTFDLSDEAVNTKFGVVCTNSVIVFLSFCIITKRLIYRDSTTFSIIESSPFTKLIITLFIAILSFFYCGNFGVIAFALLFLSSIFDLLVDLSYRQKENMEDIELPDLGPQM